MISNFSLNTISISLTVYFHPFSLYFVHFLEKISFYLATKRTESEEINEAAITDLAGVDNTFTWSRLRSLVQEDNLSTVNHICLNSCYVQKFLNFRYSYHIVI